MGGAGQPAPRETRYVTPFWNWVLTFNPGAAFSFLSDASGWQRWFFRLAGAGAASGWIVVMLRQHRNEFRLSLALTLVGGGKAHKLG